MSVAALALAVAGCGGGAGGGGDTSTGPVPPDRLAVELRGGGYGAFRVDLDCAVVDRAACRRIIDAVGEAGRDETCAPADDDGRRIAITGTIDGRRVESVLRRRTDCEIRTYDAVTEALGL